MIMFIPCLLLILGLPTIFGVCDGNPHGWDRTRRCDQYDPTCPDASWASECSVCDGVGGLSKNDDNDSFSPTSCTPIATAAEMAKKGLTPKNPLWPKVFVNTGFYEQQIFVKHDPFCLAQIPAMVSNGTHCFKDQEGTFNFDSNQNCARIDYFKSRTTIPGTNMTEYFYHLADGTVHPDITKYGILPTPACPCIDLGVGPVAYDWARDALYVGREKLGIEYLWVELAVDHFVKGPHHVWVDVASQQIVRMYQPFNGLEVFDPVKYKVSDSLPEELFKLPIQCEIEAKLGCINGTVGSTFTSMRF